MAIAMIYISVSSGAKALNRSVEMRDLDFYGEITYASSLYHVSPALIVAVIHAESNFNPNARSNSGAMGLMQIIPHTKRYLGLNDPYDPSQNIEAGAKYLRELLDLFDGNLKLALAAYNAGPMAVKKFSGVPPYSETQSYVRKVMAYYDQYMRTFRLSSLIS